LTEASGDQQVPAILYVGLVAVGYVIIYFVLKKKITRVLDPSSVLREIRGEVDRIIVELNQTTDRNISLVEDRIRRVSELLEQADRKIGLLRRESEKQELAARVYSELKHAETSQSPREAGSASARGGGRAEARAEARAQVVALHEQGISPSMIARQLGITLAEIELILSLAGKSRRS
jgi:transcriptional regulator